MSTFDDVRKLFQDIVAPDLRALGVRIDALNSRMDSLEHTMKDGFVQVERTAVLRQQQIENQIENQEKLAQVRYDHLAHEIKQVVVQMQANQASVLNALQIDRRLERLERNEKIVSPDTNPGTELARSA